MKYPTVYEFAFFFGTDPSRCDETVFFSIEDSSGTKLCVSLNTIDDSLQANATQNGNEIAVASLEGITRLQIEEQWLIAESRQLNYCYTLKVRIRPSVFIECFGLRMC